MILNSVMIVVACVATNSIQAPKQSGSRSGDKPATGYQVDVRFRVASEVDKSRVVQWTELLRAVGFSGVSEVAGAPRPLGKEKEGDPADLAVQKAGAGRVLVQASIGPGGNLAIGSDVYRTSDRGRLEALVKKLQKEGVPGPDPGAPMWGLGKSNLDLLQAAFKPKAEFDLTDAPLGKFLDDIVSRTKLAISRTTEVDKIAGSVRLSGSTNRLSLGAATSFVLGQKGLAIEPRQSADGKLSLLVLKLDESRRPWPVGLEPEQFPGTIAPRIVAMTGYATSDTPLADVLAAFDRQLDMDVLLDAAGLKRNNLDAGSLRSTIQIANKTWSSAMRQTLGAMGLKFDLRLDEANRPFIWVTVGEPTGPVKKK